MFLALYTIWEWWWCLLSPVQSVTNLCVIFSRFIWLTFTLISIKMHMYNISPWITMSTDLFLTNHKWLIIFKLISNYNKESIKATIKCNNNQQRCSVSGVSQASTQELGDPLAFDKETVTSADSCPSLAAQKNKTEPIFNIFKRVTQHVL